MGLIQNIVSHVFGLSAMEITQKYTVCSVRNDDKQFQNGCDR